MADEAIIRIILQEGGGVGGSKTIQPPSAGTPGPITSAPANDGADPDASRKTVEALHEVGESFRRAISPLVDILAGASNKPQTEAGKGQSSPEEEILKDLLGETEKTPTFFENLSKVGERTVKAVEFFKPHIESITADIKNINAGVGKLTKEPEAPIPEISLEWQKAFQEDLDALRLEFDPNSPFNPETIAREAAELPLEELPKPTDRLMGAPVHGGPQVVNKPLPHVPLKPVTESAALESLPPTDIPLELGSPNYDPEVQEILAEVEKASAASAEYDRELKETMEEWAKDRAAAAEVPIYDPQALLDTESGKDQVFSTPTPSLPDPEPAEVPLPSPQSELIITPNEEASKGYAAAEVPAVSVAATPIPAEVEEAVQARVAEVDATLAARKAEASQAEVVTPNPDAAVSPVSDPVSAPAPAEVKPPDSKYRPDRYGQMPTPAPPEMTRDEVEALWENWRQPHHSSGWLRLNKRHYQQMVDAGALPRDLPGRSISASHSRATRAEYDYFLKILRDKGLPPPDFAQGGTVPGYGNTDSVPAMLTPGEFVVKPGPAAANRDELEAMNAQGMAQGGPVAPAAAPAPPPANAAANAAMQVAAPEAEAAKEADELIKGRIKGVIGGIGDFITKRASANTDPSVPLAALGDAASSAGEYLGSFGYLVIGAGESLKAFSTVMQALDATSKRYGEYSPEIAQAQAVAEVQQTMGDLRRAQEVGPELAKYLIAQSDLQQHFEDSKAKFIAKITPIITRILEVVDMAVTSGEGIQNAILSLLKPLGEIFGISQTIREENRPLPKDPTETILFDDMFQTAGTGTKDDPGLVPRR